MLVKYVLSGNESICGDATTASRDVWFTDILLVLIPKRSLVEIFHQVAAIQVVISAWRKEVEAPVRAPPALEVVFLRVFIRRSERVR